MYKLVRSATVRMREGEKKNESMAGGEVAGRWREAASVAVAWRHRTAGGRRIFISDSHKAAPQARHNGAIQVPQFTLRTPHTGPVWGAKSQAANLIILCSVCPAAGTGIERACVTKTK